MYSSNSKRSMFGEGVYHSNDRYWSDIKISGLGNACGINKRKLELLLSSERSSISKWTDWLLLDPVSRLVNRIGRGENEGFSYGWDHDVNDIAYRKFFTVMLWALPLILAQDHISFGVDQETFNEFMRYEYYLFIFVPLWHWFIKTLCFLTGVN